MNAWGVAIILAAVLFIMLGLTGKADTVLNGFRTKAGAPVKAY